MRRKRGRPNGSKKDPQLQYDIKWARRVYARGKSREEIAKTLGRSVCQVHQWTANLDSDGPKENEPRPASEPTSLLIGCQQRIDVYAARVANGEHWLHPQDAKDIAIDADQWIRDRNGVVRPRINPCRGLGPMGKLRKRD